MECNMELFFSPSFLSRFFLQVLLYLNGMTTCFDLLHCLLYFCLLTELLQSHNQI